ncbi:hypothetical protein ACQR16_24735 [Bradyrhizobium oligotrophicum]|uniref:hypothetical protein n=1 Tax=Bradyrhizobium oligotrophicum TaxID=44255 RepID=UPI003EC002AF
MAGGCLFAGAALDRTASILRGAGEPGSPQADCDQELLVPYALFENDERLTRAFRTEREVWDAAEQADLVTFDPHGEKVLDNNLEIKPCEVAPDELAGAGDDLVMPKTRDADASRGKASAQHPMFPPQANTTKKSA